MFKKGNIKNTKYEVALFAFKGLDKDSYLNLQQQFISTIKKLEDIRSVENVGTIGRGFGSLDNRVDIYHEWFKDKAISYLKAGYELGIKEVRKIDDVAVTDGMRIKQGRIELVCREEM